MPEMPAELPLVVFFNPNNVVNVENFNKYFSSFYQALRLKRSSSLFILNEAFELSIVVTDPNG